MLTALGYWPVDYWPTDYWPAAESGASLDVPLPVYVAPAGYWCVYWPVDYWPDIMTMPVAAFIHLTARGRRIRRPARRDY